MWCGAETPLPLFIHLSFLHFGLHLKGSFAFWYMHLFSPFASTFRVADVPLGTVCKPSFGSWMCSHGGSQGPCINHIKPRALLLPTWKPVLDFMQSHTHEHTHTPVPTQPGRATKLSRTVARVTRSGQTSQAISCSRLSTNPPSSFTLLHCLCLSVHPCHPLHFLLLNTLWHFSHGLN